MKILINAATAGEIGGDLIKNKNLIQALVRNSPSSYCFVVVIPSNHSYSIETSDRVKAIATPSFFQKLPGRFLLDNTWLKRIIDREQPSVILNFLHIPLPTSYLQINFFTNSLLILDNSEFNSTLKERIILKAKRLLFRHRLKYVSLGIVQTQTMQKLLSEKYQFSTIEIVPSTYSCYNPLDFTSTNTGINLKKDNPNRFTALCLSRYYSHKNLEVLIPVARLIRDRGLNVQIVITIEPRQGKGAKRILGKIKSENLSGIIRNIGYVKPENIPALYQQCDCLLLPTLAESFCLSYIDAMVYKKPILTSDRPIAHEVCGNTAEYFDPKSPESILRSLENIYNSPDLREKLVKNIESRASSLLTWDQIGEKVLSTIEAIAEKQVKRY